jgi:hypothetical protein
MILKRALGAALLSTTLFGASASAEGPAALPTDLLSGQASTKLLASEIDVEKLQVSQVQPVMLIDSGARNQIRAAIARSGQLEADAGQKARIDSAVPAIKAPADHGSQGFGFGGSSSELDIISLQYGYMLGMLPIIQATSPEKFKDTLAMLDKLAQVNQFYGPAAQAAIGQFVSAAKQGRLDDKAYMEMLSGATQGMASATNSEVERRHGYLLLGLWSGLTTIAVEAGAVTDNLANSGNTLVMLLKKDAAFGGSDVQLAAKLEAVIAQLKSATPNKAAIHENIQAMLSVEADNK